MPDTDDEGARLIVGTYARLGGAGLVALDVARDRLIVRQAHAVEDASFCVWSARHRRLYAVAEQTDGAVREIAGAALDVRSSGSTAGAAPCHLALDREERLLAAANYESGSVALFRLGPAGALPAEPSAFHQLYGHGPNPDRQDGPHAHWVGFSADGRHLYCVDLGSDRILRFAVGDTLEAPTVAYHAPPGSGPRHLCFHPTRPLALLVSELGSTLTLLAVEDDGGLVARTIVSTLPAGAGDSLGGAIAINAAGDRVYVTNRGHDSIAVFALADETLTLLQHVPSAGASPRHLLLIEDRQRLLVADEQGGTIALFAVDTDGRLVRRDVASVAGAVFVIAAPG